jgi:hypothetical protein
MMTNKSKTSNSQQVIPSQNKTALESTLQSLQNVERYVSADKNTHEHIAGLERFFIKDKIMEDVYNRMEKSAILATFRPEDIHNFDDIIVQDIAFLEKCKAFIRNEEKLDRLNEHQKLEHALFGQNIENKSGLDGKTMREFRKETLDLTFLIKNVGDSDNSEDYGEEAIERFFNKKHNLEQVTAIKWLKNAGVNDYMQAVF